MLRHASSEVLITGHCLDMITTSSNCSRMSFMIHHIPANFFTLDCCCYKFQRWQLWVHQDMTPQVFKVTTKACQKLKNFIFLCSCVVQQHHRCVGDTSLVRSTSFSNFQIVNKWPVVWMEICNFSMNLKNPCSVVLVAILSRMAFQRSYADSELLKISAKFYSIELKIQDITN